MKAEILSTGDEIRTGAVVDSNSAFIAQKLEETGLEVMRHVCVGDDLDMLVSALEEISGRSDLLIATGGLGPTDDDITAEAAAKAANVELVLHQDALESIEKFFSKFNRPMSQSNRKQAMLPKGANCLFNQVGTAPGFMVQINGCYAYFIPGVPREMRRMLLDTVLPDMKALPGYSGEYCTVKTISTFGLPESVLGERLSGIDESIPGIKLGIRALIPEIYVKIYARGNDEVLVNRNLEKVSEQVLARLGKRVLSAEGDPMEKAVGNLLRQKKATIAIAESCTGGLVSNMLTDVSGSSDYFLFSGVTYSNDAKMKVLGVSEETLKIYGAVHEETVKEMAQGARKVAGATYGLATSGIAGPDGGTEERPVGTVCIGLASPHFTEARRYTFQFGDRSMKKRLFAITALDKLRQALMGRDL